MCRQIERSGPACLGRRMGDSPRAPACPGVDAVRRNGWLDRRSSRLARRRARTGQRAADPRRPGRCRAPAGRSGTVAARRIGRRTSDGARRSPLARFTHLARTGGDGMRGHGPWHCGPVRRSNGIDGSDGVRDRPGKGRSGGGVRGAPRRRLGGGGRPGSPQSSRPARPGRVRPWRAGAGRQFQGRCRTVPTPAGTPPRPRRCPAFGRVAPHSRQSRDAPRQSRPACRPSRPRRHRAAPRPGAERARIGCPCDVLFRLSDAPL